MLKIGVRTKSHEVRKELARLDVEIGALARVLVTDLSNKASEIIRREYSDRWAKGYNYPVFEDGFDWGGVKSALGLPAEPGMFTGTTYHSIGYEVEGGVGIVGLYYVPSDEPPYEAAGEGTYPHPYERFIGIPAGETEIDIYARGVYKKSMGAWGSQRIKDQDYKFDFMYLTPQNEQELYNYAVGLLDKTIENKLPIEKIGKVKLPSQPPALERVSLEVAREFLITVQGLDAEVKTTMLEIVDRARRDFTERGFDYFKGTYLDKLMGNINIIRDIE